MSILSNLFRWNDPRHGLGSGRVDSAAAPSVRIKVRDPWFWSHYQDAASIVLSLVPKDYFSEGRAVVDFGCGDGATTLGVANAVQADVVGVDLFKTFLR